MEKVSNYTLKQDISDTFEKKNVLNLVFATILYQFQQEKGENWLIRD